MGRMESLLDLVPNGPDWNISWEKIEKTALSGLIRRMAATLQNPVYHGEGDVWAHTKMVCTALTGLEAFRRESRRGQQILFLSALLHDIGKTVCTKWEDGRWTSPKHAPTGAQIARQLLWTEWDLAGTPEKLALREAVCGLVRYHSLPPYAWEEPDGVLPLRRAAANGLLAPDFTLERLCVLSEADALGRICGDQEDLLTRVRLCRELAAESDCLEGPYPFPSAHTRYAYLSGRDVAPEVPLYDNTWGPVILMSGLPGTGKDTWIRQNCPDIPMISLDNIRREIGAGHTGDQSAVIEEARRRAREYLRKKQPFVWNATNITPMIRRKQTELFTDYGAAVRIVYLETPWAERDRRNRARGSDEVVPDQAVCRMLENLIPPEQQEAQSVEWRCV